MKTRKKPSLKKALSKIDKAEKELYGNVKVDLSTLPCLKKSEREKITANFDADLLEIIRKLAKKHHVSYTTLMNDVLRKVFVEDKKAS